MRHIRKNAMKLDQARYNAINTKNPRKLPNASAGRRAATASRSLMATVALI